MVCSFLSPSFKPFPASPLPQTMRQRFTKYCQPQWTIFTHSNLVICWCFHSSFPFSLSFGLVLSLLLSLCSLSLPLTSEINRAKLIPAFSRIMSASVVTQQRRRERKKEKKKEREREREHEYISDIFVHLCLHCCLSSKEYCSWLSLFLNIIFNMFARNICTVITGFAAGQTQNVHCSYTATNRESVYAHTQT